LQLYSQPELALDRHLSLVQTKYTAANLFVTFSTSTAQYNLELTGTAFTDPPIRTGNASLMPTTDFWATPAAPVPRIWELTAFLRSDMEP
jgi:hypothetical protein